MAGNKFAISVKTTVPKGKLEFAIFAEEIERTMLRDTKPEVLSLYEDTVEGWKNKPTFSAVLFKSRGRRVAVRFQPVGKNKGQYNLVSAGAKPHPIFSRTTKPM